MLQFVTFSTPISQEIAKGVRAPELAGQLQSIRNSFCTPEDRPDTAPFSARPPRSYGPAVTSSFRKRTEQPSEKTDFELVTWLVLISSSRK